MFRDWTPCSYVVAEGVWGMIDIKQIEKAAKEELEKEEFRNLVEKHKEKLRAKRSESWLTKIFPWKILIVRR